jgi:thioredoxin-dependent peroxiredoxin
MISLNSSAPDFELEGSDGKKHTLAEFRGKYLVLYFYPKDDTPGCTKEACGFRDMSTEIRKLGAEIVGISKDLIEAHDRFGKKYGLNFLLLSDPESRAIKAYDAFGSRGIFGMGTLRKTYIIDREGRIAKAYDKVNPDGHAAEILEFLKGVR